MTPEQAAGLHLLLTVCEAAEAYAAAGKLLTRPAVDELRQLRQWCFSDLLRQLDGQPPTPWRLDDEPVGRTQVSATDALNQLVNDAQTAMIVGDTDNRIVAASAAISDLLGWRADDLIGHRITVVVPPALREAHVAGFTRHLVTGRRHILDQVVDIDAWHHDQYPVPVVLTLRIADDGARFYIADLRKRH
jgi:PAS domain S-box-containing protein